MYSIHNVEYQSVCPFVGFVSPHPNECVSPPDPGGGSKQHSLAGDRVRGPNSDNWFEKAWHSVYCLISSISGIVWPYCLAIDQISIKTPNPKCRLFLKIYQ
jgi:hypothetical protein